MLPVVTCIVSPRFRTYCLLHRLVMQIDFPLLYETPVKKVVANWLNESERTHTVSANWFEFSTPWELISKDSISDFTSYQFPNNRTLDISERMPPSYSLTSICRNDEICKKLELVFGKKILQSDYEFERLCLNTPCSLKYLFPLIRIKLTIYPHKS